jgi:hypothetical protein
MLDKKVGPEVNAEKIMYMFMSCYQNKNKIIM